MEDVKNKRIKDGQYEFSYKGTTVLANREPDLYFIIELGGQRLKGYLKDLKVKFAAYVDGGGTTPAPIAQGVAEVAPARPVKVVRREEVVDELEAEDASYDEKEQARINACKDRKEQIHRWVMAYNTETVSLCVGSGVRTLANPGHVFILPEGEPPKPPLSQCYNPKADRYVWPAKYCDRD